MSDKRRKIIMALLITAFVALLSFVAIYGIVNANRGQITINTIPDDSTVILGDKQVSGNRQINVTPGTYKIRVSRSGFAEQTKEIKVAKDTNESHNIYLEPNSPEGFQWLQDHPEQAHEAEAEAGRRFEQTVQEVINELPLIKELPFIDQQYRIDYGRSKKDPNNQKAVAIYIKYWADIGKEQALEWIRFKGYDPNKLEIIYTKETTAFD